VVCLAPRALEDSVRPRHPSGVVVRPLNFTVRTSMRMRSFAGALPELAFDFDVGALRHRPL